MCNRHAHARALTAALARTPSATPGRVANVRCLLPRKEGVTPPVCPASRSALRQGLPARRTVTTDTAHARARSGDGYTLFGMVKTAISTMENQGPPGGEMRGTLCVSMRTDWRSAVAKRCCITRQRSSPVSIKSFFWYSIWSNVLTRPYGLGHVRQGMRCSRRHSVLGHTLLCCPGTSCVRWHAPSEYSVLWGRSRSDHAHTWVVGGPSGGVLGSTPVIAVCRRVKT